MKNFFKKIKSYSFWVSFSAAMIMLLNALGKAFGFQIENQIVEDCIMSIAGILVVFGIVSMNDKKDDSSKGDGSDLSEENNSDEKVETENNSETNEDKDNK